MIVSVFIDKSTGTSIGTRVDEVSSLRVSDLVQLNNINYIIVAIKEDSHYDYSLVVSVIYVSKVELSNDETQGNLVIPV